MKARSFNLTSALLTAMMIVAFVMSPQAYGTGWTATTDASQGEDRCCQPDTTSQDMPSDCDASSDCCPEPCQEKDGPCSCLCSKCSVMPRTASFFSDESFSDIVFGDEPQPFKWITDRQPASASLGVDVQPPII